MLPASEERITALLDDDAVVLDVGGWASPFARADWVLDLMPYETRGLYGSSDPGAERFTPETWIERDICDREPFPFDDGEIDFAICSHTLEDIRDPVWVCSELNRVAKAGYVESPSRLEEQSYGVHGPWVGWSHHHWLVEADDERVQFVFKPGVLQGQERFRFPQGFAQDLTPEERVVSLFWEDGFAFGERIFLEPGELDDYLADFVARESSVRGVGLRRGLRGRRR